MLRIDNCLQSLELVKVSGVSSGILVNAVNGDLSQSRAKKASFRTDSYYLKLARVRQLKFRKQSFYGSYELTVVPLDYRLYTLTSSFLKRVPRPNTEFDTS